MRIEQEITTKLRELLSKDFNLGISEADIKLEIPPKEELGNYSSNVAMLLAKRLGKSPAELAKEIVERFDLSSNDLISDIKIAGPGFINFYISPVYYKNFLLEFSKDSFLKSADAGQKVMIEFTDPNPFKEFHIGHLYSNSVGESLARLLEASGFEVFRVCYQGDVGLHVAKAVRGMQLKLEELSLTTETIGSKIATPSDRAKFLGEAYAHGATLYEENAEEQEIMKGLNRMIYAKDKSIVDLYELGRTWSLEYFETVYKLNGTNRGESFDYYYFESEVADFGRDLVLDNLEKGIFVKSEGAVIFPGEKYGLHNRVFVNSQGIPTYEAKELGLAPRKYKDVQYDKSIIVTANEIQEYFKVLLKALSLINPDLANRTLHVPHGMVRLPEGKMSSRKGNVLTGEWLINEAIKQPLAKMKEAGDLTSSDDLEIQATKIGISAIKYAFLKVAIGKDIEFNLDESLSIQGSTGPSVLYAYTRARSILKSVPVEKPTSLESIYNSEWEARLLRLIYSFPSTVKLASDELSPHILVSYVYDLVQAFNNFYSNCPVVNAESEDLKLSRAYLVQVTAEVIQSGLDLLGIETVERM